MGSAIILALVLIGSLIWIYYLILEYHNFKMQQLNLSQQKRSSTMMGDILNDILQEYLQK